MSLWVIQAYHYFQSSQPISGIRQSLLKPCSSSGCFSWSHLWSRLVWQARPALRLNGFWGVATFQAGQSTSVFVILTTICQMLCSSSSSRVRNYSPSVFVNPVNCTKLNEEIVCFKGVQICFKSVFRQELSNVLRINKQNSLTTKKHTFFYRYFVNPTAMIPCGHYIWSVYVSRCTQFRVWEKKT